MSAQILTAITSTSSAIGLLSLIAYFYMQLVFAQKHRSFREIVEGDGTYSPKGILKVLKQFKSDEARLKALKDLTNADGARIHKLLDRINKNVDIEKLTNRSHSHHLRLLLVSSLFFIAISIISFLFSPKGTNQKQIREQAIIRLKENIMDLRGTYYETIDLYKQASCAEVRKSATTLGHLLLTASSQGVRGSYEVIKYQYAAFSYMMAADVETNNEDKITLSDEAINAAQKAIETIDNLKKSSIAGSNIDSEDYNWTIKDDGRNRTLWILAKAYAIKSYCTERDFQFVETTLDKIEPEYRKRWDPKTEPDISWILNGRKTPKPDLKCL